MRSANWIPQCMVTWTWIIALLLAGCDGAGPLEPEPPTSPKPPVTPVKALHLDPQSDTNLTGMVGMNVAVVPVVRLTNLDGSPAPGRNVRFTLSSGGWIRTGFERTDTAGMASPGAWTLGTVARPQKLTAHSDGAADVVFTAMAQAGPPAIISIMAGNNQSAAAGAPLPIPLQIKLSDQYENPVPDRTVAFSIVAGTGTILGGTTRTDSAGLASSGVWTLGGTGAQAVMASGAGESSLFQAFACDNPCRGRDFLFARDGRLYSMIGGVSTHVADEAGYAAWSPDGGRIALATVDWDEHAELYLMDADGSNVVHLASGFIAPSWSPDGRTLAVSGPDGVYTIRVDQSTTAPVLLAGGAQSPAWSPDGSRLALFQYDGGYSLKVMNLDGSGVTTLLRGEDWWFGDTPTWSPDGSRLAFAKCVYLGCGIFAVNSDGADLVQLTEVGAGWAPAWSPDGSRIAFNSSGGSFWVPAEGSFAAALPLSPDYFLAWRP